MNKLSSKAVFITGTDTGVGKTMICGLMARYFHTLGIRAVTQKWVQTGCAHCDDIGAHLSLMGRSKAEYEAYTGYMAPYRFNLPASPHLAARLDGDKINTGRLKEATRRLSAAFDLVIVEGAGGVDVPLDEKTMMIDLCVDMKMPVIVVSVNRVGTINHTVLTIEALKNRGAYVLGVIYNRLSGECPGEVLEDNPVIIKNFTGVDTLGEIFYAEDPDRAYGNIVPAGERMLKKLMADHG